MEEIEIKDLKLAQKNAGKKAISQNKKAGLKTYIIKNDNVVEVAADGEETIIKKAEFATVASYKRIFVLKDGNKKD